MHRSERLIDADFQPASRQLLTSLFDEHELVMAARLLPLDLMQRRSAT
jgi:hypothetical protein